MRGYSAEFGLDTQEDTRNQAKSMNEYAKGLFSYCGELALDNTSPD